MLLGGTVGEGELSWLLLPGRLLQLPLLLLLLAVLPLLTSNEPLENGVIQIVTARLDVLGDEVQQLEVEFLPLPHHPQEGPDRLDGPSAALLPV